MWNRATTIFYLKKRLFIVHVHSLCPLHMSTQFQLNYDNNRPGAPYLNYTICNSLLYAEYSFIEFIFQKHYTKVSVFVEPPSPEIKNDLRVQRINEIRRHSSHSPSLTVKEYDKEKDRRHSGFNPNLLGLDSEHMRFLNCSPAATRRISCGSLFKVCLSNPKPKRKKNITNFILFSI